MRKTWQRCRLPSSAYPRPRDSRRACSRTGNAAGVRGRGMSHASCGPTPSGSKKAPCERCARTPR
eukprot:3270671-Prymnesium_polylepis.1